MIARRLPFLALLPMVFLTGCGGLEIKATGGRTVGISDGNSTVTGSSAAGTPLVFTNASAVIVGEGDTVYALSRRHRVSARDIIEANGLRAPYHLTVGQRIVLPRGTVHTVRSGETLYAISRTYDANVYEIARANGIGPPYTIFADQKIRIPGTVQPVAASSSASASGTATQPAPPKPQPAVLPKSVPTPPPATGSGFVWPVDGKIVSGFGPKAQGLHNDGINIAASEGAAVRAAENGVVAYAGNELRGFGNLLLVKHSNGFVTAYAHASELLVKRGDKVKRGQAIALVGSTGSVSSPQLHFEVRKGKTPLDPRKYLPTQGA